MLMTTSGFHKNTKISIFRERNIFFFKKKFINYTLSAAL